MRRWPIVFTLMIMLGAACAPVYLFLIPSKDPRPGVSFRARREEVLDVLGDLVEEHLDTDALWRLIESGPPPDLPFLPPGGPR